jgi:hypothetical protein
MKRIRLSLTGIGEVLKESAEKRLEEQESYQIPTCSNGKTEEFYQDIGIPIPPDLEEKLKIQDKGIKFEDDDFEDVYSDISIYEDEIVLKITADDITTLYIRGGYTVDVLESVDEIDSFVDFMNLTWTSKKLFEFSLFRAKIKNKILGLLNNK